GMELLHACQDLVQPDLVGPEHGAAAIGGKAVAVDPDHVDIQGAVGNAFFQNLGTFVDHHVHATFQDFLLTDLPRRDALFLPILGNQCIHSRVWNGSAASLFITVHASLGLLPQAILLSKFIHPAGRYIFARFAAFQANAVTHID